MNELIAALRAIETDPSVICPESGHLTEGYCYDLHPLVQEVVNLANGELITNKGECNYAAHRTLKLAGFPVTRGEYDSFGWLSGLIHTKKGIIVYG